MLGGVGPLSTIFTAHKNKDKFAFSIIQGQSLFTRWSRIGISNFNISKINRYILARPKSGIVYA